jgi:hypothetical protein
MIVPPLESYQCFNAAVSRLVFLCTPSTNGNPGGTSRATLVDEHAIPHKWNAV